MPEQNKVLLIGLDGVPWDVLNPLVKEGIMPNVKKIISEGASGELESIMPPVTGPSWLAMATGLNPGKTGVFDFIKFDKNSFNLFPMTSDDYRGRAFWDIASNDSKRVFVLNFPMLYPPYRINGAMISGLGAEDVDNISYPRNYLQDIVSTLDDYMVKVPYNLSKYTNNEDLFFNDIERLLSQYKKILSKVLCLEKFDLLTFIFQATDLVMHYTWKYWDKDYFAYKEDYRLQGMIRNFWREIDGTIGYIYDYASSNNANLFLVSDHGFGGQDEIFRINSWLAEKGFLRLRIKKVVLEKIRRKIGNIFKKIDKISGKDSYTKAKVKAGRKRSDFFHQFDLEKSHAVAGMHSDVTAGIYIVDKDNREKIKNDILCEIKKEESKSNIKAGVILPNEIYSGELIKEAPDILFYINEFRCSMNPTSMSRKYYEVKKNFYPNKSGTHRLGGILIAWGSKIRKGVALKYAKILDICPTVLYLMGLKIPSNVDGVALKGMFTDEFLSKNEVRYAEVENVERPSCPGRDAERTINILKSLGYL